MLVTSLRWQAAVAAATPKILDAEFSTADLKAGKYFTRLITGNVTAIVSLERSMEAERQADQEEGDYGWVVYESGCGSGSSESWTIEIEGVLTVHSNGSGVATQSVVYTASLEFTIVDYFDCTGATDTNPDGHINHIDNGCNKVQSSFDECAISYGDGGDVLTDAEKIMLEMATTAKPTGTTFSEFVASRSGYNFDEEDDFGICTLSPLVKRLVEIIKPFGYNLEQFNDLKRGTKCKKMKQMRYDGEIALFDIEGDKCETIARQAVEHLQLDRTVSDVQLEEAGVTTVYRGCKPWLHAITRAIVGAVPTPTTTVELQALVDAAIKTTEPAAVSAVAAAVRANSSVGGAAAGLADPSCQSLHGLLADAGVINRHWPTDARLSAITTAIAGAIDAGHPPTTTIELQALVDKGIAAAKVTAGSH